MKIVTVAEMRALEQRAVQAGVEEDTLMEAAGLGIARRVAQWIDGIRGRRILVLVGPGNNGGDGMVAARYLADWGALVTLYMTSARRRDDKFEDCRARRVRVIEASEDPEQFMLASYVPLSDVVVDAVLGIGNERPLESVMRQVFTVLRQLKTAQPWVRLVAVDIPTGLNADTGEVDEACPAVDLTLALGAPKVGLFRFPGAAYVGKVETIPIGVPDGVDGDIKLELANEAAIKPLLPSRPLDGHKGTFGHVVIVAGSRRFVGAAVLAASSAYRSGAGLVTLAATDTVGRIAAACVAEPVHLPLAETPDGYLAAEAAVAARDLIAGASAAVIGPGLGDVDSVQRFVQDTLLVEPSVAAPVVLDADALNVLARTYGWAARLRTPAVLTPHPGEMARLLNRTVVDVQSDRIATAREAAHAWGQVVVLKGAHTVVAAPNGEATIVPFANPALGSGGTGDVLAGVVGALLAQGLTPYEAALAGTYIHGCAAERVREELGDSGLMASDLLPHLPRVFQKLRTGR